MLTVSSVEVYTLQSKKVIVLEIRGIIENNFSVIIPKSTLIRNRQIYNMDKSDRYVQKIFLDRTECKKKNLKKSGKI